METDQFKDANRSKDPDVELIFKPLKPNDEGTDADFLQVRYIKTTINATIDHLVKYISMRHLLDCKNNNPQSNDLMKPNEESLFEIYQSVGPGQFKPLPGNVSLKQIASEKYEGYDKYKKICKPLELHYNYKVT